MIDIDDGHVRLVVEGEIDLATAALLTDAVERARDAGASDVELDLSHVRFIDSSGVGAIILGHRAMAAVGGRLVIGDRSSIVARVLDVSGLEQALGG